MKWISVVGLLLAVACGVKKQPEQVSVAQDKTEAPASGHYIALYAIDNRVKIMVDDSVCFDSKTVHDSPEVNASINLTPLITHQSKNITIELYNGEEPYNDQIDPLWEVRYEYIVDGEVLDFVHDHSNDNALGIVFSKTYSIKP